jgi:hypothetical protein
MRPGLLPGAHLFVVDEPLCGRRRTSPALANSAGREGTTMRMIASSRSRLLAASIAAVAAAGVGIAAAGTAAKTPSNATMKGTGVGEFGMTKSFYDGHTVSFTYTKGFYCDTSVKAKSSSGCEAGANFKKPPAKNFDPLFITVPIGSAAKVPAMSMECPQGLVCVDHPGTIDLSRLESTIHTIAPYNGLSKKALTSALQNFATPGHEHFITTRNGGKGEWWDVKVVAVTSTKEYNALNKHASYAYLAKQIKDKKAVGPIDTNLFLYFAVK